MNRLRIILPIVVVLISGCSAPFDRDALAPGTSVEPPSQPAAPAPADSVQDPVAVPPDQSDEAEPDRDQPVRDQVDQVDATDPTKDDQSGESPAYFPADAPLVPVEIRHGTIYVPEGWIVSDVTYTGDQIGVGAPGGQRVFISIFTFFRPEASEESIRDRWQFKDRDPQPFRSANGREGLIAEGPHQVDPDRWVLSVGFWWTGLWEHIVEASAPKEMFAEVRPLLERILASYEPDPRGDK